MLVSEKQSDYSFICYQNIGSMFFRFVTKHACDRRIDRQNYDLQYRASIAASRSNNF